MKRLETAKHIDMCEGPLFQKIIAFAIPIMLSGLLQLAFNAADLMVVGNFCGNDSVAAVGSTSALVQLLVNFFMGISSGAGVVVAQSIGEGNAEKIRKTVHTIMPLALCSGLLLTLLGVLCTESILIWMGTPSDILPLAALYTRIYFCGTISSMVYNFGAAILRADGDTKRPLYFLTTAGVVNVLLNLVFVIVLHMDVAGVALATILSQTVSAVLVVWALTNRNGNCTFNWRRMRFCKQPLLSILRIGIPAGVQASTFSLANVIIQSSVNSFGAVAMSGAAAAQNLTGFLHVCTNSFHHAALNFTGQNYGAKKFDRIKRTVLICVSSAMVLGLLIGVAMYVFATPLLSLYIPHSTLAIRYGTMRLLIATVPYFLVGIMDVFTGVMRGMGSSTVPMFVTIFANCLMRVVWVFTVFRFWGTWESLYLAYPVSWTCGTLVIVICFLCLFRKKQRMLAQTE